MNAAKPIYFSDDNGQMACDEHAPLYGRIPWHRMSASEQVSMCAELSEIMQPEDSRCEMCRSKARRAKAGA